MTTLESIAETQQSIERMLSQRMAEFETQLTCTSLPSDCTALAKEFYSFKDAVFNMMNVMKNLILDLSTTIDNTEMRHRKKFLLLSGLQEKPDENLPQAISEICCQKLGVLGVTPNSIIICHRLGLKIADRNRPVLFKISNVTLRNSVWKAKTKLKGTSLSLSEFLTRQRQQLFQNARKSLGLRQVWTSDGNIFVKLPQGSVQRIQTSQDLEKLISIHQNTIVTEANAAYTGLSKTTVGGSSGKPELTKTKRIVRKK